MANNPLNVGIIGTGNIAPAYVKGCAPYQNVRVTACADLDLSRAQAFAQEYNLRALSVDAIMADPDVDILINLTVPNVHAEVSLAIIACGKHVYSEKPLATNTLDGQRILQAAAHAGVRVGCAPDTVLGGGIQTCRHLIDEGAIGTAFSAVCHFASLGPASWHPNPFFFYQPGAGPVFDMGPYYLTTLITLLGPVAGVNALTRRPTHERIAGAEGVRGQRIPVDVATHTSALLDFANGATASLILSFDIGHHHLPRFEVYGTAGTLTVPDPNTFDGPVGLWTQNNPKEQSIPLTHRADLGRGAGVADMAQAIQQDRPHRASGALAYHVLEIMEAFDRASQTGQRVVIQSTVPQPEPLPTGDTVVALST